MSWNSRSWLGEVWCWLWHAMKWLRGVHYTVSLVSASLSPQMVLPASLASVRNTLVPYLELTTVNIIYPLIDNLIVWDAIYMLMPIFIRNIVYHTILANRTSSTQYLFSAWMFCFKKISMGNILAVYRHYTPALVTDLWFLGAHILYDQILCLDNYKMLVLIGSWFTAVVMWSVS